MASSCVWVAACLASRSFVLLDDGVDRVHQFPEHGLERVLERPKRGRQFVFQLVDLEDVFTFHGFSGFSSRFNLSTSRRTDVTRRIVPAIGFIRWLADAISSAPLPPRARPAIPHVVIEAVARDHGRGFRARLFMQPPTEHTGRHPHAGGEHFVTNAELVDETQRPLTQRLIGVHLPQR